MGFNTGAWFVEHSTIQEVVDALDTIYRMTDQIVAFDDVYKNDELDAGITQCGEWIIIWDAAYVAISDHEPVVAQLSVGRRIFGFFAATVGGQYGFDYYIDGTLVRENIFGEGEHEVGEPLPEEQGMVPYKWGFDEDFVLTVCERITGISYEQANSLYYRLLKNIEA